jgi:hypothetical protein
VRGRRAVVKKEKKEKRDFSSQERVWGGRGGQHTKGERGEREVTNNESPSPLWRVQPQQQQVWQQQQQ